MSVNTSSLWPLAFIACCSAAAQDLRCDSATSIRRCVQIDAHPSGPLITTDFLAENDAVPVRRFVEGARSGTLVLKAVRLIHVKDGSWRIKVEGDGGTAPSDFAVPDDRGPLQFDAHGYSWQLMVMNREHPIEIPGVATEAEFRLDVDISRLGGD